MTLSDIPLFDMMKSKLGYVSQRERLISQNVANANTPGYTPKDLKVFTIPEAGGALAMVQPARTDSAHLSASSETTGEWKTITSADSETKLDGNKVSVQDEMAKLTASRMDYEMVIGFYEKSIQMYRMAATAPGKTA